MGGIKKHIVIMGLLLVCSLQLKAQIDPTLAGMVYLYTEKAEDQLKKNVRGPVELPNQHLFENKKEE